MKNINLVTENINDDSANISQLLGEVKEIFDDTFDMLDNMVTKNGIWLGYSAEDFRNEVMIDKQNYIHFRESLNKYSNYLSDYSLEMNKLIGMLRK